MSSSKTLKTELPGDPSYPLLYGHPKELTPASKQMLPCLFTAVPATRAKAHIVVPFLFLRQTGKEQLQERVYSAYSSGFSTPLRGSWGSSQLVIPFAANSREDETQSCDPPVLSYLLSCPAQGPLLREWCHSVISLSTTINHQDSPPKTGPQPI